MKKINLEEEYLDEIKGLLGWKLKDKNVKAYIFGSRATGNIKKASDIDLALDANGEKLPFLFVENLKGYLQASNIPYKVDILDYNTISDSFKTCIKDDLIEVKYQ